MIKVTRSLIVRISILFIIALFFISNSNNPPNGFTNAPGDSTCSVAGCHTSPGTFTGNVVISGLPATVSPNTTYTITVQINNFDQNAVRAGFQLVALDDNANNAGSIIGNAEVAATTVGNGRIYAEHDPAKNFVNGLVTFTFDWTAPSSGNNITMYVAGNIANGSGKLGDVIVNNTASTVLMMDPLVASVSSFTEPSCNGGNDGTTTASATGGELPYSYIWSDGQSTPTAIGCLAATYTVTVTDNTGATSSATINLGEPDALVCNITPTSFNLCNGDESATANVICSGGTFPYSYLWSEGTTTNNVANLGAGVYTITVTDENGCSTTESFTVTEPSPIVVSVITSNETANNSADGTAVLESSGGTGGYTFEWNTGSISGGINNLSAGTYTVTVSDSNGCTATASGVVSPFNCTLDMIISEQIDISCAGGNDGKIAVLGIDGTEPYNYQWSNNVNGNQQNQLTAGDYVVTITDASNCTVSQLLFISEPEEISISPTAILDVSCSDVNDGEITIEVNGGVEPYVIDWSNGMAGLSITNLSGGNYMVTVTDDNLCMNTSSFSVVAPEPIVMDVITVVADEGTGTGSIDIELNGGTEPYSFSWMDSLGMEVSTDMNLTNAFHGNYTLLITDANNCTLLSNVINIEITVANENPQLKENILIYPNPVNDYIQININALNNAQLEVINLLGENILNSYLENGNNKINIENLIPGIYLFKIRIEHEFITYKIMKE